MSSYLFLSAQADKEIKSSTAKTNFKKESTMDKQLSNTQKIKSKNQEDVLRRRKERFGEVSPPRPTFHTRTSKQVAHILAPKANIDLLRKRKERFGESVSGLLKKIEEKEKLLKRQARFCDKNVINIPPETKQVKLKTFEGKPKFPSGIEVFKTIDQIDEEERKKREWQY